MNYEDDEYDAEEWYDPEGEYPEEEVGGLDSDPELEDDDDGGSGKLGERFLVDAFLRASGACK